MNHLGVKLYAEKPPARIGEGGDRRIAALRQNAPARWHPGHLVAMAHPYLHGFFMGESIKQVSVVFDPQFRGTVLPPFRFGGRAAESKIHHSHAVADA
jgi:hypothetical protein